MSVDGGKKINIITTDSVINSITKVELKNILEETLDNNKSPIYSDNDITNLLRLYDDDINWMSIVKSQGLGYDFASNEFIFKYYMPIYIGETSNIITTSSEFVQRNININKIREKNLNLKGVSKIIRNKEKVKNVDVPDKIVGIQVKLSYPIDVINIEDSNVTKRRVFRYNTNNDILYNGLILPTHNVSKKSMYGNRIYKHRNFKDIIISGYYNAIESVRDEYMIFMSPYTYKLDDGSSILPIIYPFYGRDNSNVNRIIISKDVRAYVKKIASYMQVILKYAHISTPLIYNNITYRYLDGELIKLTVGDGHIVNPKPIIGQTISKKEIEKILKVIKLNLSYYLSISDLDLHTWLNIISRYNLEKIYYYSKYGIDISMDNISRKVENTRIVAKSSFDRISDDLNTTIYNQIAMHLTGKSGDKLTQQEEKQVKFEIERRNKLRLNILSNTCPHIKLLHGLIYGSYSTSIKSLGDLVNYMVINTSMKNVDPGSILNIIPPGSGKNSTDIIQCSNCKLPIICPHVYHQYKLEHEYVTKFTRNSNTVLRDIKNFMIRNYTSMDSNISNQIGIYYCKICGGKVAEDEDILDVIPDVNLLGEYITSVADDTDIDINKIIYLYSSNILKNNITFKNIIDPKIFIGAINKMVKQNLHEINEKLNLQSGTSDIHSKLHPYAIINVVMAFAIIIINRKEGDINFVEHKINKKEGGATPAKVQEVFNTATKIILQSKNVFDRNEIPIDHIKKLIIITYRKLSGEDISTPQLVSNLNLRSLITVNPLYQYLYKHINLYSKRVSINDTQRIVNLTPNNIISGNYKRKTFEGNLLDINPIKPPNHPINLHKEAVINNLFKKYLDLEIYTYPQNHINRVEYYEEHAQLKEQEVKIQEKYGYPHQRYLLQKTILHKRNNNPRKYTYNRYNVKLNHGYDNNGHPQKWNTFQYKSGKYKQGDDKLNILSSDTLVDIISASGQSFKSISTKNNKEIVQALTTLDNIHNFYTYYQFRCPQEGLHNFKDNQCTKCKATSADLQLESKAFYTKYSKVYLATRAKLKDEMSYTYTYQPGKKFIKKSPVKEPKYDNIEFVNQVAKTFSIPQKVFLNIGLMEKVQYTHVSNGKLNPYNNLSTSDDVGLYYVINQNKNINRISRIGLYINNMFVYYKRLLDFDQDHMPIEMRNMLKPHAKYIAFHGTKELVKLLPNIREEYNKFMDMDNLMLVQKGNKLLYFLAYTLQQLHNISSKNKDINKIAADFASFMMKYIIHNENMLSLYDEDQLRRDNSSRYEEVREQMSKLQDANANENLEIIQLYDPELAKEHGYKEEMAQNMEDNSFEMSIDVDAENEIEPSDN